MNKNFLNAKAGKKMRFVKVNDIQKETINNGNNGRESEKIIFTVADDMVKREFKISDSWIALETEPHLKIAGLWYLANDEDIIAHNSTLAKLLTYYDCESLADMMYKEVKVYPDPKGYLVLVSCDATDEELDNALISLKEKNKK